MSIWPAYVCMCVKPERVSSPRTSVTVVSCHVGSENQTQVLCKAPSALSSWAVSPAPSFAAS